MKAIRPTDFNWVETPYPGVTKALCATHGEGGAATLWRVPKGSGFPEHGHNGFEYIYLVSGHMVFSGIELRSGDFLATSRGEMHAAKALEDSSILVVTERSNA